MENYSIQIVFQEWLDWTQLIGGRTLVWYYDFDQDIHFDQKLAHAQHYIGFCEKIEGLESRLEYHRTGRGSRLLKAVSEKGIGFKAVRTWPDGDRNFERKLKNRKSAKKLCPVCKLKNF